MFIIFVKNRTRWLTSSRASWASPRNANKTPIVVILCNITSAPANINIYIIISISSPSSSYSFKVHILPFTEVGLAMISRSPLNLEHLFYGRMSLLMPTYLVGLLELMVGNTFIEVYRHPRFKYHLFSSIYDIVVRKTYM